MLSAERLSRATYDLLGALDGPEDRVQTVLAALTEIAQEATQEPAFDGLTLAEVERLAILAALNKRNGVQKDAARDLDISQRVMNYKVKQLGIRFVRSGGVVTVRAS